MTRGATAAEGAGLRDDTTNVGAGDQLWSCRGFLTSVPGVAGWVALALPGGFLILVTVLALVSALSKCLSRRDAAYRVLALIWPRPQPHDKGTGAPHPDDEPPALPPGRRPRRRR